MQRRFTPRRLAVTAGTVAILAMGTITVACSNNSSNQPGTTTTPRSSVGSSISSVISSRMSSASSVISSKVGSTSNSPGY